MLLLQSRLVNMDLLKPDRQFLKEGEVQKISRKEVATTIYLVLLNDCLLYTKYQEYYKGQNTDLWVSHILSSGDISVKEEKKETDIIVYSSVRTFTFRTRN